MATANRTFEHIAELSINDFGKDSSRLLMMNLDEFVNEYKNILSVPRRTTFYQMVLLMEGEGCFWIDSNKYKCRNKTLFAVSKGQVEIMEFDSNIKGHILLFSEECINKYPGDLEWINNLKLFDPLIDPALVNLSDIECIELAMYIRKMEMELKTKNDFASCEILANLLKTIILVSERISRARMNVEVKNIRDWNYVLEFKKKLEEQYDHARSVHFYAEYLSVTPKRLNQITNSFWGKSAKRLIEERVLLETQRLLVHTSITIKEIGYTLGFTDPTNFNKFFKRYFGITPAEFRTSKQKSVI
jgi:AraC family transcriptional regulator, transcriptional activator of pobA